MRYYRCKCGNCVSFGSLPPYRCSGCKKCNTNLTEHPDDHKEPEPHDFTSVEQVMTDEGYQPVTRCRWCGKNQKEL